MKKVNISFPKLFELNMRDLGKAFIVTMISSALTTLYQSLAVNAIPTVAQLKAAALIGLGTGISYLIKQLITGVPKAIEIDPAKTIVINQNTKEIITPHI